MALLRNILVSYNLLCKIFSGGGDGHMSWSIMFLFKFLFTVVTS